jgi:hypothetical protein
MPVRTVRRMKDGSFARMENRGQSVPIWVRSTSLNMPVSMAFSQESVSTAWQAPEVLGLCWARSGVERRNPGQRSRTYSLAQLLEPG